MHDTRVSDSLAGADLENSTAEQVSAATSAVTASDSNRVWTSQATPHANITRNKKKFPTGAT